jgi:glycosyltransferase involved in cell wall biosynthesis
MPRLDLYDALHPLTDAAEAGAPSDAEFQEDPNGLSYRSGFWATVPLRAPAAGELELRISATLADGTVSDAAIGTVRVAERTTADCRAAPGIARRPSVVIAMATFDPDPELFRRQVESIQAQTMEDWLCVISDDCSPSRASGEMRATLEGDDRFVVSRSETRRGFYRNFERALQLVPESVPFVALADQDDHWYPDKLQRLLEGLGDALLVYSDLRVIDAAGRTRAETYWTERKNNFTNLTSLLITNTVTGAASLFRRELLDLALPFPDPPGTEYHDHWLALVALATGRIAYVDRPLYDYVQHEGAQLGHHAANAGGFVWDPRVLLARLRRGEWMRVASGWRAAYFFGYLRLRLLAEVLLVRCADRMDRRSRRTLRRFIRSERSPLAFTWLAARRARKWLGMTETLGLESLVLRGILWRNLVNAVALIRNRPIPGLPYGASLPESTGGPRGDLIDHMETRAMARSIEPLQLAVSTHAPERLNLLIPTMELKHLFGGYIAKFNLARKLAEHGLRTRILTIDATPPLPRAWRQQVESYAGLHGIFDRVEVAFARDRDAPIDVNPQDAFVATTWRTAHIAHAALRSLNRSRFLYLIQEYEPYTHAMGSWAALAMSTYEFPHVALFSTELLRDFFAERGYGVFAAGRREGRRLSATFRNAITAVSPPSAEEMSRRPRPRLLFYARPEAHGHRNMFELGLMGLAEAVAHGTFGPEWEFHGIGAVEGRDRLRLAQDVQLELLPRLGQGSYADFLVSHDVGLALMCTPHPSLVPIEMASAGMLTVTNSFETKTPEAMSAISANLITPPPSLEGIVSGLREAVEGMQDYPRRVEGARVSWSRDWDDSFNADVMRQVVSLLAAS